jgi:hypothetical protein
MAFFEKKNGSCIRHCRQGKRACVPIWRSRASVVVVFTAAVTIGREEGAPPALATPAKRAQPRMRTHAHARARMRTHAHARARTRTHAQQPPPPPPPPRGGGGGGGGNRRPLVCYSYSLIGRTGTYYYTLHSGFYVKPQLARRKALPTEAPRCCRHYIASPCCALPCYLCPALAQELPA